jgi:hypothetical protein
VNPPTIVTVLVQAVSIAVVGWAAGDLLLGVTLRGRGGEDLGIGAPERGLAAVAGYVAFAIGLMLAHIVSGGAVFGVPGIVPVAGVALVAARRRSFAAPASLPWRSLALAGGVLLLLFAAPAAVGGSGVRSGDPAWHLGWTEQLLGGEPVPVGPAPEFARNAYPWGWHAVLASAVRLVPGTDPLIAHESLHVLVLLGLPLAAACLARRLAPDAAWGAAAASSLIGGFGWLSTRPSGFAFSPREAHGADLVITSPNTVFASLPPALPRELGLVLLALVAVVILVAVRRADARAARSAGVVTGFVALVSVPLLITAFLWGGIAALCAGAGRRVRLLLNFGVPAVVLFLLWAGPVAAAAVRFGGFVNVSRLGREWPLPAALASWGLLLPLAASGAYLSTFSRRESHPGDTPVEARIALAWGGCAAVLLGLASARRAFGWELAGNATLLNQNRVWPPAHLLASAFAGVAVVALYRLLSRRSTALAAGCCGLLLAVGAVSPTLAALSATEVLERGASGYVYSTPDLSEGGFVRRAAARLGPDDVVDVAGSDDLAWALWQFSGVRLAHYDDPRLSSNDLRIRYAALAGAWEKRLRSAGGFPASHEVLPAGGPRAPGGVVVARGGFAGDSWELIEVASS